MIRKRVRVLSFPGGPFQLLRSVMANSNSTSYARKKNFLTLSIPDSHIEELERQLKDSLESLQQSSSVKGYERMKTNFINTSLKVRANHITDGRYEVNA